MAKRNYPIARVAVAPVGSAGRVVYDGFGQQDRVARLMREGLVTVNAIDWGALGLPAMGQAGIQVPAAMLLRQRGLDCVVARPCLDTVQQIGLGHFTTYGGSWESLPNHGLNQEMDLYQYEATGNQTVGAVSNFTLPADPVMAMSLFRTQVPDDFDWSQYAPYTEIHFGVTPSEEWVLCFPYGAPLYLMRRVGGLWWKVPNTERSVRVPSLSGYGAGQRLLLWLAVWRGKLVLSTDGFASDTWVYEAPDGPVRVKAGKWSLWHNAGQFMFSFLPIKMPTAVLDSAPVETGYDSSLSSGALILTDRQEPVTSDAGGILAAATLADTTAVRTNLSATQRAWRATIAPYVWTQENVGTDPDTGAPVGFSTCVSPQLAAVSIGQYAQVETPAAGEAQDISDQVSRIEGSHSDKLPTVRYTLALDNQLGQQLGLTEYQPVAVELGWQQDDGTQALTATAQGYAVNPPPEVRGGGEAVLELALLDGLVRLRDEKADGRVPVFDGWATVDVYHWVLDRCGIPRAQQSLEDTGTILSLGQPEKPLWLPEPGRSWVEFLTQVGEFDYGAVLYVDASGVYTKACPFCRTARTAANVAQHDGSLTGACGSEVSWQLYTRPSEAPDPTQPGEVLDIAVPRLSLSDREYVNYVAVCGVDQYGRPIRSVVWDAASLYDPSSDRYVGWRKMEVKALHGYATQAEANRLAQEIYTARSGRPEYLTLVTPLEPGMQIGQVLEVYGAEQVGAGGQAYRIVALEHKVERSPKRVAVTWVKGKWVGSGEE